jgi:hypothetical protein
MELALRELNNAYIKIMQDKAAPPSAKSSVLWNSWLVAAEPKLLVRLCAFAPSASALLA